MSIHIFGGGMAKLSNAEIDRRSRIAEANDAEFISTPGDRGQCVCGHGHSLGKCPTRKFWYTAPNRGDTINGQVERRVLAAVAKS